MSVTLARILLAYLVMHLIMLNAILVIPPHFGSLTIAFFLALEGLFLLHQTVLLVIFLALFAQTNPHLAQFVTLGINSAVPLAQHPA